MTANERAALTAVLDRRTTDDLGYMLARCATWQMREVITDILARRYAAGPRWVGAPAKDLTRW